MKDVLLSRKGLKRLIYCVMLLITVNLISRDMASGEVTQITEARDRLEGISEKEQEILNEMFLITQNIEVMRRDINQITADLNTSNEYIEYLEYEISSSQQSYDSQLELMEQVLVSYQRGGPASYLEILLSSDSLGSFLKSINLLKNITRNVNDLLIGLDAGQIELQKERDNLAFKVQELEEKEAELAEALREEELLKQELNTYLVNLQMDRTYYEKQLNYLEETWNEIKGLFPSIIEEFSRIIEEGYITEEDIELKFQLIQITGTLREDTFNQILEKYSTLPRIKFHFKEDGVDIEVPDQHLFLSGNFVLDGATAIRFDVESGSFYDMDLEKSSIDELFSGGELIIDFKELAGDNITINFKLQEAVSNYGYLSFIIRLLF